MIRLDRTTRIMQAILAGAKATLDAQCTVCYYDVPARTKMDNSEYVGATTEQDTNGTNAVTICDAPPDVAIIRNIDFISIHNYDTAAITVTVQIYNSTGPVTTRLMKKMLNIGESLVYEVNGGWQVL
jgi:hypothetical protein